MSLRGDERNGRIIPPSGIMSALCLTDLLHNALMVGEGDQLALFLLFIDSLSLSLSLSLLSLSVFVSLGLLFSHHPNTKSRDPTIGDTAKRVV